jgi:hypothetical protein
MNDPLIPTCTTPTCAARTTPPYAADGCTVCARCIDRLREHCLEIPALWEPWTRMSALLPARSAGPRAPGIALSAPVNLTTLAMLDPRTSWEEQGDLLNPAIALGEVTARVLRDGAGRVVDPTRIGVGYSCGVLGRGHLHRWALAQEWAGLMCWTVRLVRDQLGALAQEQRPRPVGVCEGCGGWLWVSGVSVVCRNRECGVELSGFELVLGETG